MLPVLALRFGLKSASVVLFRQVVAGQPWFDGCLTGVGDAAHATTPFLAQGGAMALEVRVASSGSANSVPVLACSPRACGSRIQGPILLQVWPSDDMELGGLPSSVAQIPHASKAIRSLTWLCWVCQDGVKKALQKEGVPFLQTPPWVKLYLKEHDMAVLKFARMAWSWGCA